jgi:hypothetical protein
MLHHLLAGELDILAGASHFQVVPEQPLIIPVSKSFLATKQMRNLKRVRGTTG